MSGPITATALAAATELLAGVATRTPVIASTVLSEAVGGPVLLKCENLQRTGSFKIRGAYVRMARLSAAERSGGVVAASAGNHAQGVALAARLLGIRATVVMPVGAPLPKVAATRGYGAEILLHGETVDEALVRATDLAAQTGAVLIHPFDHEDIVLGQATCGVEIVEQVPDVATVLVPLGGGGLLAGVAAALRHHRPHVRIIGVQAADAAAYPASLAAGHPLATDRMNTMADGIAVGQPGEVPFALIRDLVDEVRTVDEEQISRALLLLLERAKLVVEPAGAVGVAAMMASPQRFAGPVVTVLSGGNVDPILQGRLIRHGMAAAGRYLNIRVRISDRPGALARLMTDLAAGGANVVAVSHERTSASLRVDEVEVRTQVETRGADHAADLIAGLRDDGYDVAEVP